MTKTAALRIAEMLFRRWPFYLLLFVLALAAGFAQLQRSPDLYTSKGSIFVNAESLVVAQSGVRTGNSFGFASPAQYTSNQISGLLSTDLFMGSVADSARIDAPADPEARRDQLQQFRESVAVLPSNNNIAVVLVTTSNPELSAGLAQAIVDEYLAFQVAAVLSESGVSEEYFADLAEDYRQDLTAARDEVDAALRGVEDLTEESLEKQTEVQRLKDIELRAEARYQAALEDFEGSQLAARQTETEILQTYTVLDQPAAAVRPNGRLLSDLIQLAMFGIVGIVLAIAVPVVLALADRTVLFEEDLDGIAPVIASVPKVRKRSLSLVGAEVVPGDGSRLGPPMGPRTAPMAPVHTGYATAGAAMADVTAHSGGATPIEQQGGPPSLPEAAGVNGVRPWSPAGQAPASGGPAPSAPPPQPATSTAPAAVDKQSYKAPASDAAVEADGSEWPSGGFDMRTIGFDLDELEDENEFPTDRTR